MESFELATEAALVALSREVTERAADHRHGGRNVGHRDERTSVAGLVPCSKASRRMDRSALGGWKWSLKLCMFGGGSMGTEGIQYGQMHADVLYCQVAYQDRCPRLGPTPMTARDLEEQRVWLSFRVLCMPLAG